MRIYGLRYPCQASPVQTSPGQAAEGVNGYVAAFMKMTRGSIAPTTLRDRHWPHALIAVKVRCARTWS